MNTNTINIILDSVRTYPITAIKAETGAGKSTEIPIALSEFGETLVTNQRRLACISLANYVAKRDGSPVGSKVGYALGRGVVSYSKDTKVLYCTEGLELVRAFVDAPRSQKDFDPKVVVLDEAHMWTLEGELILALLVDKIRKDPKNAPRVVLMSATLDTKTLTEHLGDLCGPVINVPGRVFPIEHRHGRQASSNQEALEAVGDDVQTLVGEGRSILIFAPGKKEIEDVVAYLKDLIGSSADVISLHGQMTDEDQHKAFKQGGKPKVIVSTNVAETSVTIPEVTAVIDLGMERQKAAQNGREQLLLVRCSKAAQTQRAGRAGRVAPGIAIDHSVNAGYWGCFDDNQFEHTVPEIQRSLLDLVTLRLRIVGLHLLDLPLVHSPNHDELEVAERVLTNLRCVDEDGNVTALGHDVAKQSTSVRWGVALLAARKLGCEADLILAACACESGGLLRKLAKDEDPPVRPWYDEKSAHWTYVKALRWARGKNARELYQAGLVPANVFRAQDSARDLARYLDVNLHETKLDQDALLRAVLTGHYDLVIRGDAPNNFVYLRSQHRGRGGGTYMIDGQFRPQSPEDLTVGVPFTLRSKATGKPFTLLSHPSAVTLKMVREVVPWAFTEVEGTMFEHQYDIKTDTFYNPTTLVLNPQKFEFPNMKIVKEHSPALGRAVRSWASQTDDGVLLTPAKDQGAVLFGVVKRLKTLCDLGHWPARTDVLDKLEAACAGYACLGDVPLEELDVGNEEVIFWEKFPKHLDTPAGALTLYVGLDPSYVAVSVNAAIMSTLLKSNYALPTTVCGLNLKVDYSYNSKCYDTLEEAWEVAKHVLTRELRYTMAFPTDMKIGEDRCVTVDHDLMGPTPVYFYKYSSGDVDSFSSEQDMLAAKTTDRKYQSRPFETEAVKTVVQKPQATPVSPPKGGGMSSLADLLKNVRIS